MHAHWTQDQGIYQGPWQPALGGGGLAQQPAKSQLAAISALDLHLKRRFGMESVAGAGRGGRGS